MERQENMLLFYHAMTNDLLCKHPYTEGTGKTIELPPMEQRLSIEYELSEYYRDNPTATEFLKQLKLQSPRFCYQQCRRLKKLRQYYNAEELDIAFSHCLYIGICTMLELASYLMYRYGEERIKRCVPETVYISYQKAALPE